MLDSAQKSTDKEINGKKGVNFLTLDSHTLPVLQGVSCLSVVCARTFAKQKKKLKVSCFLTFFFFFWCVRLDKKIRSANLTFSLGGFEFKRMTVMNYDYEESQRGPPFVSGND